jgi:hypothetical protein
MWAAMAFITLLFFMSIYGAFIGPERAKEFFNSIPLAVYWIAFILLLAIGIALFPRLIRKPALLFLHFACILILLGGIWGSQKANNLQKKLLGIDKIPEGAMQIFEGYSDNRVITRDNNQYELPFSIGLKDFRIEYYKAGNLYIKNQNGNSWRLPARAGKKYSLGDALGTVEIVRVFENFKMTVDGENRIAIDDTSQGSNPALQVQVTSPEGRTLTRYVFEPSRGYMYPSDNFVMAYIRDIRDFVSELQVIRDNKVAAEKDIEVNHPLHYGGYHFYQQAYDDREGKYTILKVTSDSGLSFVYTGYILLCLGICWHFWIGKLRLKGT